MKSWIFLVLSFWNAGAFAVPGQSRLDEISSLANRLTAAQLWAGVVLKENYVMPGPAWSRPLTEQDYLIEYNPQILGELSESSKNFIFYHELGHRFLHHHDRLRQHPEDLVEIEFEADAFAVFLTLNFHLMDRELMSFFNVIRGQEHSRPTGLERFNLITFILGQKDFPAGLEPDYIR